MFCDQCGAHLQSGQTRCVRCGKAATGLVEDGRNRVREHVRLVGILWMAYSSLHVMAEVAALFVAKFVLVWLSRIPNGPPPQEMEWLPAVASTVGWLILVKAATGFAVGWGLLQREEWARMFALVLGFVVMLNVPNRDGARNLYTVGAAAVAVGGRVSGAGSGRIVDPTLMVSIFV